MTRIIIKFCTFRINEVIVGDIITEWMGLNVGKLNFCLGRVLSSYDSYGSTHSCRCMFAKRENNVLFFSHRTDILSGLKSYLVPLFLVNQGRQD